VANYLVDDLSGFLNQILALQVLQLELFDLRLGRLFSLSGRATPVAVADAGRIGRVQLRTVPLIPSAHHDIGAERPHRRVECVRVHVHGDAVCQVLEWHVGAEVGAVAGGLVRRVLHEGSAVGDEAGDGGAHVAIHREDALVGATLIPKKHQVGIMSGH